MNKNNMCILKGIGIIIATGMMLGFVVNKMTRRKKCLHKKANTAIHAVGDLLDNVHYMFR